MPTVYRNMLPQDEDAVFDLRMNTWGGLSRDWVRQGAYLDPLYSRHTFVALGEDGALLSTVRYWPRHLRDVSGKPARVGCVASVVTIESARRQGHANRLMQMALDSMKDEGFDWTFLLASDMGVPLYEGLDFRHYSAPYWRGYLVAGPPSAGSEYTIEHSDRPFDVESPAWQAVRAIYASYNAQRPLSLVRDDEYWRGYYARRIGAVMPGHSATLFIASTPQGEPVGYLLAYIRQQETPPGQPPNPHDSFVISEAGAAPGQDEAISALLAAVTEEVRNRRQGEERPGGTVFLPGEERFSLAIEAMFGSTTESIDDRTFMARPISANISYEEIAATFAAPTAHFWRMDDF